MTFLVHSYFFSSFFPTSVFKWHAIFMYFIYFIEERDVRKENLYYIIWYLNRKNCEVETIFIVRLLLQRGMTTS